LEISRKACSTHGFYWHIAPKRLYIESKSIAIHIIDEIVWIVVRIWSIHPTMIDLGGHFCGETDELQNRDTQKRLW
jgi:hypothetical protein